MNKEQNDSLVSQLKGVGLDDEQILDVFYEAFSKGKMDRKDLEVLADSLGYELDDDFKNEETPDPINSEENAAGDGITESEAEDLKEIKPGESKEECQGKVEEAKSDESESESEDDESEKDEDEDEEEETMKKYFKI